MPSDNIEALFLANEAFNRGDVEAAMSFYAPDAEVKDLAGGPDQAEIVSGREAIREAWELWTAAFDELRCDTEELTEHGDVIISHNHWQGRGKASGMSIDLRQFDLFELRDGKIVRSVLGFRSKEEAVAAAGLDP